MNLPKLELALVYKQVALAVKIWNLQHKKLHDWPLKNIIEETVQECYLSKEWCDKEIHLDFLNNFAYKAVKLTRPVLEL